MKHHQLETSSTNRARSLADHLVACLAPFDHALDRETGVHHFRAILTDEQMSVAKTILGIPPLTDIQKKYGAGITPAMHRNLEKYENSKTS